MLSAAVEAQARDAALGLSSSSGVPSSPPSKSSHRLYEAGSSRTPQQLAPRKLSSPGSLPSSPSQQSNRLQSLSALAASPSQQSNRLEALPETTNRLTLEERNQLLKRQAKLVKLLGDEVIEVQKEKLAASPGTPTRKLNALQLRGQSSSSAMRKGSPDTVLASPRTIAAESPTKQRRRASLHAGSPLKSRSSSQRLQKARLMSSTDENQDPRDSASIRRMRSEILRSPSHGPRTRDADDSSDDEVDYASGKFTSTTFSPLPSNVGSKAAAVLGLDLRLPATTATDLDRQVLQIRRGHRGAADHLSLAPSLQESDSTSLRSKRSLDSLHQQGNVADEATVRKRTTSNASRQQRSISLYSDSPTALADMLRDAEENDEELEGDEDTMSRRTRRRRADKMSRWLGSVVPAHIVAPEAHNSQPAYMSHELPSSARDFMPASSSSSSLPASPVLDGGRHPNPFGDASMGSSARNGNRQVSGSSLLPSKLRHHSSGVFERRSSPLARPTASLHATPVSRASDILPRSDSSDLTPKEKSERVKRASKLEAMLGHGAGAAALQSEGFSHPSESAKASIGPSGSSKTLSSSVRIDGLGGLTDLSDDSGDLSVDSFQAGSATSPPAIPESFASKGHAHSASMQSHSTSSESTFASPGAVLPNDADDSAAAAAAAEELHRRRVATARKLNKFFGQSVPGEEVAVANLPSAP